MKYRSEYDEEDKTWYIYWDKHFINPSIVQGLEQKQAEDMVEMFNDLYYRLTGYKS